MTSLPYADADCSLRALAGRAEGFGRFAVGGLHGDLYVVTSLAGDVFVKSIYESIMYQKLLCRCFTDDHTGIYDSIHIYTKSMADSSLILISYWFLCVDFAFCCYDL